MLVEMEISEKSSEKYGYKVTSEQRFLIASDFMPLHHAEMKTTASITETAYNFNKS